MKYFALVSMQSASLSSATQHAVPPELGGKWGTECLNTRFPLPNLLCAGYSVKLILICKLYNNNYYYRLLSYINNADYFSHCCDLFVAPTILVYNKFLYDC